MADTNNKTQQKTVNVKNPHGEFLTAYRFELRVNAMSVPLKAIRAFSREAEYEYIQEGGINDYVHIIRKQTTKPYTLQVERYVTSAFLDPLPVGLSITIPMLLSIGGADGKANIIGHSRRYYMIFGGQVLNKETNGLDAEHSGLLTETVTIAYTAMFSVSNPFYSPTDQWAYAEGRLGANARSATHNPDEDKDTARQSTWEKKAKENTKTLQDGRKKLQEDADKAQTQLNRERGYITTDKDGNVTWNKWEYQQGRVGGGKRWASSTSEGDDNRRGAWEGKAAAAKWVYSDEPKEQGKRSSVDPARQESESVLKGKSKKFVYAKGKAGGGVKSAKVHDNEDSHTTWEKEAVKNAVTLRAERAKEDAAAKKKQLEIDKKLGRLSEDKDGNVTANSWKYSEGMSGGGRRWADSTTEDKEYRRALWEETAAKSKWSYTDKPEDQGKRSSVDPFYQEPRSILEGLSKKYVYAKGKAGAGVKSATFHDKEALRVTWEAAAAKSKWNYKKDTADQGTRSSKNPENQDNRKTLEGKSKKYVYAAGKAGAGVKSATFHDKEATRSAWEGKASAWGYDGSLEGDGKQSADHIKKERDQGKMEKRAKLFRYTAGKAGGGVRRANTIKGEELRTAWEGKATAAYKYGADGKEPKVRVVFEGKALRKYKYGDAGKDPKVREDFEGRSLAYTYGAAGKEPKVRVVFEGKALKYAYGTDGKEPKVRTTFEGKALKAYKYGADGKEAKVRGMFEGKASAYKYGADGKDPKARPEFEGKALKGYQYGSNGKDPKVRPEFESKALKGYKYGNNGSTPKVRKDFEGKAKKKYKFGDKGKEDKVRKKFEDKADKKYKYGDKGRGEKVRGKFEGKAKKSKYGTSGKGKDRNSFEGKAQNFNYGEVKGEKVRPGFEAKARTWPKTSSASRVSDFLKE